jgi:hypothetical protein
MIEQDVRKNLRAKIFLKKKTQLAVSTVATFRRCTNATLRIGDGPQSGASPF